MEPSEETRVLVEKAQQGDRAALDELARRYQPRIEPWIEKRLGDHLRRCTTAAELAQETFLRVLRSLDRFQWKGEASFWRWLKAIALHAIQDEARRTRPEGVPVDDGPSPCGGVHCHGAAVLARDPSPSKVLEREERFQRLQEALLRLRPEDREVILLVSVKRVAVKEVAERLGKTAEAVSMQLVRALRKLQKAWGQRTGTESVHLPAGAVLDPEARSDPPGG